MRNRRREAGRGSLPLIVFLVAMPFVIGLGLALFRTYFLTRPACENEVVSHVHAPDGAHRAVVFRRSCGTTTPWSTNVSILPEEAPLPDDGGNVLVLRDIHDVAVEWTDATRIVVRYPRDADAFLDTRKIEGIEATLEPR